MILLCLVLQRMNLDQQTHVEHRCYVVVCMYACSLYLDLQNLQGLGTDWYDEFHPRRGARPSPAPSVPRHGALAHVGKHPLLH